MNTVKVLSFMLAVGLTPILGSASVNPIFSNVVRTLKRTTHVPLLLPKLIPRSGSTRTYAIVEVASRNEYSVLLSPIPSCRGEHACTDARILGSTARFALRGSAIKLSNGRTAYYDEAVCNIYCNESTLTWTQHGYSYRVAIKAGSLGELLTTANSMKTPSP